MPAAELQAQARTPAPAPTPAQARPPGQTVTLITGDRVALVDGAPLVTPAPGRARIKFSVRTERDHVWVVPEDVAALIAADQVDLALFDVALLLDSGYGDQRREDLPLLLTYMAREPALARRMAAELVVDRELPALHTIALRQPKARAGAALAILREAAVSALAPAQTPAKLWLDRVHKPLLDHSVPQIGGPAAHARGFTGAGVAVAVLDTGVDSSHPDLAGKVVAAEDFTGDGGVLDDFGHGTHVASIIAGTGAASSGQFAGVAPDAQILSGRVCVLGSCATSWMLAGMSWAVIDQHAKIVNLSIGGPDTPEIDPLEDAVNQLSAQFGTLFVIAAGNDGGPGTFGVGTIDSPGSADAALTVGAVDRDDQLAVFSSRGPRVGDHAIKPDVTAPGVDIVAARAANVPPLGDPVGAAYQRLSGTSMATPHVAGAAALLLQQHPDWTAEQLKAQLIATAQPTAGLTAFEQGAGRIDIDRGTRQAVEVAPGSLSLGRAAFPHDDDPPIVRTVRYRNGGGAPITLAIAASLSQTAGGPTPPGMIGVAPAQVMVPAGGTGEVTVTVTTRGDLADGLYSGALVATAVAGGDVRIETPIAVEREFESFDLVLDILDNAGAPTGATVFVTPADDVRPILFVDGSASLRLRRGRYAIDTTVFGFPGAFLAYPRLQLDADTKVVFDSRLARPVAVDVGDPGVTIAATSWQYIDYAMNHATGSIANFALSGAQLGPDAPPDELVGSVLSTLSDDPSGSPTRIYNLAHSERGHVPAGWRETLGPAQLATVDARHVGRDDAIYDKGAMPVFVDPVHGLEGMLSLLDEYHGPFERTERFFGPGFIWSDAFVDNRSLPEDPDFPTIVSFERVYRAHGPGQHVTETWNQAPFGPAFVQIPLFVGDVSTLRSSASRLGDQLFLRPSIAADTGSPARLVSTEFDHQRISLFRNGTSIAELVDTDAFDPFTVPPGPAIYRYEQDIERPADIFELSPHITVAWTFRSQHVAGDRPRSLALPTMRFSPPLDLHGRAAGPLTVLPIALDRPPGADTPPIVSVHLEVSFDDGAQWLRVPVLRLAGRWFAAIVNRPGARFVSLRGDASDALSNRIDQTIIHAYGLTP